MSRRKRTRSDPDAGKARPAPGVFAPAAAGVLEPAHRWRPWLLGMACALLVARLLFPSEAPMAYGDGLPLVLLWIALAVLWLLAAFGSRWFPLRFGLADAAVLALVGLHTASAVWAAWHGSPRPAVNALWQWIAYGLSFLLLRQLVVKPREARAVLAVMLGLGVALAAYGLFQYSYEMPRSRAEYERNKEAMLREAGLHYPEGSPERLLLDNRVRSVEPLATFALTNSLAGYLAPWLIVGLGMGMGMGLGRVAGGPGRTRLWAAVACATLPVGLCLVLTKSRTAYLATLLGIVLVVLSGRKHPRRSGRLIAAAAVAVGALVAIALAVRGLDVQVLSEAGKSFAYRLQYWQASLGMIADHPWAGCGPGQFQDCYTAYKLPTAGEEIADPHNFLLEIWATAGTPAMVALVAMLVALAAAVLRARRRPSDSLPDNAVRSSHAVADNPWFVYAGGAAGAILGILVGQVSEAPPGLLVLVVGFPAAAAVVALLAEWVDRGALTAVLPAIGVLVLLVNLSAAGALAFAGVAGTLWLLSAIALNEAAHGRTIAVPRAVWGTLLVGCLGLAIACYGTASAVLNRGAALHRAQSHPARAEQDLLEATRADPWAVEPWAMLAAAAHRRWQQTGEPETLGLFESSARTAAKLAPHASTLRWQTGEGYLDIFFKTGQRDYLEKALAAYRQAVDLYPTSAMYQASLALVLKQAGDQAGFEEHRQTALRLDAITPHQNRKLPDELRKSLQRNTSGSN